MPDPHCPHLAPVGGWCRLGTNLKCSARPGRIGCPFPSVGSLEQRTAERDQTKEHLVTQHNLVLQDLARPFPAADVRWRVRAVSRDGRRALVAPHVDPRALLDRLDALVGPGGWSDAYELDHERAQAKCTLTVLGVAKQDVGEGPAGQERPAGLKAAVADALERAAVKFGVGRYLAKVEPVWVDYDADRSRPLELPALPGWAVPAEADTSPPAAAALPVPEGPVVPASLRAVANPAADGAVAELVREIRGLPGGEHALRRLVGRGDWARRSPDEKRRLYGELRRTYRELNQRVPESA